MKDIRTANFHYQAATRTLHVTPDPEEALDELRRDAKRLARELQQGLPKRNAAERLEAMAAAAQVALDAYRRS